MRRPRTQSESDKEDEREPPSSVVVGNLMWTLTAAQLLEFGRKGHPSAMSATIARLPDMRSKGWGLITYASLAAAETAIEALNGTELNNRRVHVRIDDNRQEADHALEELRDEHKRQYQRSNESEEARHEDLRQSQRTNQRLRDYADNSPAASPPASPADVFTVYAGNISFSAQDSELRAVFNRFDPLSCIIMRNPHGTSRGYALVRFRNQAAAEVAIAATDGLTFQGRQLKVRIGRMAVGWVPGTSPPHLPSHCTLYTHPPQCRPDRGYEISADTYERTVYVGRLPAYMRAAELSKLFGRAGAVRMVRIFTARARASDINGKWATVLFDGPQAAQTAVNMFNNFRLLDSLVEGATEERWNPPLDVHLERPPLSQRKAATTAAAASATVESTEAKVGKQTEPAEAATVAAPAASDVMLPAPTPASSDASDGGDSDGSGGGGADSPHTVAHSHSRRVPTDEALSGEKKE